MISTPAAGTNGSTAHAPTATPTAADALDAPSVSAWASSSGDLPGNWARSVSRSLTGILGAIASTRALSHRPPAETPRPVTCAPRLAAPLTATLSRRTPFLRSARRRIRRLMRPLIPRGRR